MYKSLDHADILPTKTEAILDIKRLNTRAWLFESRLMTLMLTLDLTCSSLLHFMQFELIQTQNRGRTLLQITKLKSNFTLFLG